MNNFIETGWQPAVDLLVAWERQRGHLDELFDQQDPGQNRWLVREVFRNWLPIENVIMGHVRKTPRPVAMQILRLAVAECMIRTDQHHARIVHHAVDTAKGTGLSESECRFVNAVLRTILREGTAKKEISQIETHPGWLVDRWRRNFGEPDTLRLIEWNQGLCGLTVMADACPGYAEATKWEGYYQVVPGRIGEALEDLRRGTVYAQDPFARIPVALLELQPGERTLDLCAAPGGKTRLISDALGGKGIVVALDRPGARFTRLRQNVKRMRHNNVKLAACSLEELTGQDLLELAGTTELPAVLIDVPCSNTGVMRTRPDVKLRLQPEIIPRQARIQLELLEKAAHFVAPGGRLVYSTCSIEPEENTDVIKAFLEGRRGWSLGESVMSYPWNCDHDGGGAFLLTRDSSE